jgi:hypothetical protein
MLKMGCAYCGNIGTESFLRFITHGNDGATVTARSIMKDDFHPKKRIDL